MLTMKHGEGHEAVTPLPPAHPVDAATPLQEGGELTYSPGHPGAVVAASAVEGATTAANVPNATHVAAGQAFRARAGAEAESALATQAHFPGWLLGLGFLFALGLALYCLMHTAQYMDAFKTFVQEKTVIPQGVTDAEGFARITIAQNDNFSRARLMLMSCGVCIGLALGFLGFALFLVGAQGTVDAAGEAEKVKITLSRLSPGLFVILCGVVLVGYCATFRVETTSVTPDFGKSATGASGNGKPETEAATGNSPSQQLSSRQQP